MEKYRFLNVIRTDISVFHRKVSLILLRKQVFVMRKSGLGLALLFSLIAPIKAVYAEAIMISGKLQADLPAVSFDPGPGDFVAYVNSNTITASGAGTACNVTVDDRATSSVDNLVCF